MLAIFQKNNTITCTQAFNSPAYIWNYVSQYDHITLVESILFNNFLWFLQSMFRHFETYCEGMRELADSYICYRPFKSCSKPIRICLLFAKTMIGGHLSFQICPYKKIEILYFSTKFSEKTFFDFKFWCDSSQKLNHRKLHIDTNCIMMQERVNVMIWIVI